MKHDMQIVKGEHNPAVSGTAKSLRHGLLILLAVVMMALSFTACHEGASGTTDPSSGSTEAPAGTAGTVEVIASTYPRDAVPEITELIAEAICKKITTETHPSKNKGLKGAGIYVSPYYTLTVNETEVPAYCTAVYTPATAGGVLHSFSRIEIKGDMPTELSITLTPAEGLSVENAAVAPRSLGVTPTVREGAIHATIDSYGHYTFLINDDDQRYAFTLSVSEYVDEDAEIAALKAKYPEDIFDGVTVFEPGVHYVDPMTFVGASGKVIYIKRGALLIAKHIYDLNTPEDSQIYTKENYPEEDDGATGLGIGLPRKAVIGAMNNDHLVIAGHGTMDFSMLDHGERNGITITYSKKIDIHDITLINCSGWTVTVYNCEDVSIRNVITYSWRVGSDSFDLCNSRNVTVEDCFSRGGDDIYVVKTLAGAATAVSENITVKNCIAWAGKARAFSIAAEAYKDFKNILFEDCGVVIHDSVWDTDYVASLAIVLETLEDDTTLENVVFRDIEIYRELGRAVLVNIHKRNAEECTVDVLFENITIGTGTGAVDMKFDAKNQANSLTATLNQVSIDDHLLTKDNIAEHAEILGGATVNFP